MKKYKLVLNIILYFLCVLLTGFYLYVFYLGFHPNVSDQYRAYYIDHTVSQWTP